MVAGPSGIRLVIQLLSQRPLNLDGLAVLATKAITDVSRIGYGNQNPPTAARPASIAC